MKNSRALPSLLVLLLDEDDETSRCDLLPDELLNNQPVSLIFSFRDRNNKNILRKNPMRPKKIPTFSKPAQMHCAFALVQLQLPRVFVLLHLPSPSLHAPCACVPHPRRQLQPLRVHVVRFPHVSSLLLVVVPPPRGRAVPALLPHAQLLLLLQRLEMLPRL